MNPEDKNKVELLISSNRIPLDVLTTTAKQLLYPIFANVHAIFQRCDNFPNAIVG